MEKKNPNIYQRALDIVNHRINPDIPQGGGGESAPEVENAIETHGLGWTSEEEIPAIDITWDGNTEGLERVESYVKISDLDIPNDQIVGLKYDAAYSDTHEFLRTTEITQEMFEEFSEFELIKDDYAWLAYWFIVHKDGVVVGDYEFAHKGMYVADPELVEAYISHIYKEATTEEVVHQIDQKYIPGGSGGGAAVFVNLYMDPVSEEDPIVSDKTLMELQPLINSGATIIAKLSIGDSQTIFWPLIQYYEVDGVPAEAYFGYPIYNSTTDSSSPVLMARLLTEDGDTEWICTMFN